MNSTITIGAVKVTGQADVFGGGSFHIGCGRCGESVTYSGREFTVVEGRRHEAWCSAHKG
jgi:hypothetical protein